MYAQYSCIIFTVLRWDFLAVGFSWCHILCHCLRAPLWKLIIHLGAHTPIYIGVYILCADKFIMVTNIVQNLWPVLRSVIDRSQDSSNKALMLTSWQTQLHGWVHHATKMALKFDTFIQQQWWWAVLVFDFRTKNVLFQDLNLACRMFFHLQIRSEEHLNCF